MAIDSAPLNLLVMPRRWRPRTGPSSPATLTLAVLALPQGDPRASLQGTPTPFADADLSFEAVIVPTLDALPQLTAAANQRKPLATAPASRRRALFDALARSFTIRSTSEPQEPPPGAVKKFLPHSYRNATQYTESDSQYFVTDASYTCALKDTPSSSPPDQPGTGLEWEEILALVLRQPLLATGLGLLHTTTLALPEDNPFDRGGYLFADLAAGSAYRAQANSDPGLLARFAARIPPLAGAPERSVFAAVLFPATEGPGSGSAPGTFDEVFVEADAYDDGFARAVHGDQAHSAAQVDQGPEPAPGALPPVKDTGIRLGWDDEQVTVWLNRQFGVNALCAGPAPNTPSGVAGYRVDVREEGATDPSWHSLAAVHGDRLELDGMALGPFDGELTVDTLPVNHTFSAGGEFWLPSYFTAWTGGSNVLTDPGAFRITGKPQLGSDGVYRAVTAGIPPLRYGRSYRFRVRLADLAGGGPTVADAEDPAAGPAPTTVVHFRRYVPPGPVRVDPGGGPPPDGKSAVYQIRRPLLGYPDILYTGLPQAMDLLLADAPAARAAGREAALPDPDVTRLRVDVLVRTLDGDPAADSDTGLPYVPLYSVTREFPPAADQPLVLGAVFEDIEQAEELANRLPGPLAPLCLPTARDVRLVLTPVGRPDPTPAYWGTQETRTGTTPIGLKLRARPEKETGLLAGPAEGPDIQAVFLQPDEPPGPVLEAALAATGRRRQDAPSDLLDRLAHQLRLVRSGLTLSAPAGTRLVLGAANSLRHILGHDRSSLTFAAADDLALRWLVCVRLSIERDWTWDGLDPVAFSVRRDGAVIGEIVLPRAVGTAAAVTGAAAQPPDRERTQLVFLDAYDPKPGGTAPREARLGYTLTPIFRSGEEPQHRDPDRSWRLNLPITTPPAQVPRLRSAGFAADAYVRDAGRYTFTGERLNRLYVELDRPPDDPDDRYFARVLAYGPDPMLLGHDRPLPEPSEPPLAVDEPVRVIVPGSSRDAAGLALMQPLVPAEESQLPLGGTAAEEGRRYLLPLPEGMDPDAPELFGFFVYELRVGHDGTRWTTAHGRFGPPLRVAGVQHPPPRLRCAVARTDRGIAVRAPHAAPVHQGVDVRPFPPTTRIGALLYAQVLQADGRDWRNVLVRTGYAPRPDTGDDGDRPFHQSEVAFGQGDVRTSLQALGLPADTSLSVLAVELLPEGTPDGDPLVTGLGSTRILRASRLVPVPTTCPPRHRLRKKLEE